MRTQKYATVIDNSRISQFLNHIKTLTEIGVCRLVSADIFFTFGANKTPEPLQVADDMAAAGIIASTWPARMRQDRAAYNGDFFHAQYQVPLIVDLDRIDETANLIDALRQTGSNLTHAVIEFTMDEDNASMIPSVLDGLTELGYMSNYQKDTLRRWYLGYKHNVLKDMSDITASNELCRRMRATTFKRETFGHTSTKERLGLQSYFDKVFGRR